VEVEEAHVMHLTRRRLQSAAVSTAVALSLAACGGDEPADNVASDPGGGGEPQGLEEVCAAAEEEDAMEAWLNFSNPDVVLDGFKEAYPEVDVEVLTILPEDAVPRIVTESTGGQPTADVFYGGLPSLAPLAKRDMVAQDIDWESLDVKQEYVSPIGTVRVAVVAYGIGYNTDKYSAEDLPDTWEGLIDPKWDGKLLLDPRGRPYSFLSVEWGQEKTVEHVKELMEVTNPVVMQGTTAGLLAVASGEGDILLNSKTAETQEQLATGAPLGIKLLDTIPVEGTQLGVVEGTEQPNAAKCFVSWVASEDGSKAIFEGDFKTNELPPEVPADANTVEVENEEDLATSDATIEELSALITGGGG
jgi:iron(III) transport system substrate-binding protein